MNDIYQEHPKWKELENICGKIEELKIKAKDLREEIDADIFGKDFAKRHRNDKK